MRIRHAHSGQNNITLQMTPMIDIVFQMLVFFIMTFKVVVQEGDFNIRMPASAPATGAVQEELLPMRLRLVANADGDLVRIQLNEQSLEDFQQLHQHILAVLSTDAGPAAVRESAELEIESDYQLRYEYIIAAITAVSGYRQGDDIIKLIERIRFTPPEPAS